MFLCSTPTVQQIVFRDIFVRLFLMICFTVSIRHYIHVKSGSFKGTVEQDFFHQSTPHRALIHGLRPFRIWARIRRENRQYSNFSGVNDPAETTSAGSF
jgi:hypothetical protein